MRGGGVTLALWDRPALAPRFPAQEHSLCRGSGFFGTRCGAGRCAAALWPSQATTALNLSLWALNDPLPGEMTRRR